MKINKYIIAVIFFAFSFNFSYAQWWCAAKNWQERYNCEIKTYCDIYKPKDKNYKSKDYFETDNTWEKSLLENAKKKYRENQNDIYKCAIIKLQKNSYKIVKNKLLQIDKTWIVKSFIDKKIDLKIKKLDAIAKNKKCILSSSREEWNSMQLKKELLKESAYEYCKYSFYLEFLKNHYTNIKNANKDYFKGKEQNSYKVTKLSQIYAWYNSEIINEQTHSSKVFWMAFQTYIDYENNFPVHILLELIKQDYIVLRRKLYEAISPIDQVVYKISNAMSIH